MNEITKYEDIETLDADIIEQVVIKNNLSVLTAQQRLEYYNHVCKACRLDPVLKPFDYIILQGKETLYANKNCAAQLRRVYGVSVTDCDTKINIDEGIILTKVTVKDHKGRVDSDVGVVLYNGKDLHNAIMKSVTKAKRRATLSICGLGMLDETEIESVGSFEDSNVCKSSVLFEETPKKATEPKKDKPKDEPKKDEPETIAPQIPKASVEVLNDAYAAFIEKHFDSQDFSHFNKDAFDKAVFEKYGKYPTNRESISKIIKEIDPNDVMVAR